MNPRLTDAELQAIGALWQAALSMLSTLQTLADFPGELRDDAVRALARDAVAKHRETVVTGRLPVSLPPLDNPAK